MMMVILVLLAGLAGLAAGWLLGHRGGVGQLQASDHLWRQRLLLAETDSARLRSELADAKSRSTAALAPSPRATEEVARLRDAMLQAQSEKAAALAELDRLRDAAASATPRPAAAPPASPLPDDAAARAASTGITAADPAAGADDLRVIKGVGPKLEDMLHSLGIFTYGQIAAWTEADVAAVDERLGTFRGRIERDGWIAQARALVK